MSLPFILKDFDKIPINIIHVYNIPKIKMEYVNKTQLFFSKPFQYFRDTRVNVELFMFFDKIRIVFVLNGLSLIRMLCELIGWLTTELFHWL